MVRRALKIVRQSPYVIMSPGGDLVGQADSLKRARALKKQLAPPPRTKRKYTRKSAVKVYPAMQPVMVGS